ncbi:hypothetical protein INR49_006639 [Caranx melampygus]|nr:hypothetical protein INR49_006639 [Caranx melampygus]
MITIHIQAALDSAGCQSTNQTRKARSRCPSSSSSSSLLPSWTVRARAEREEVDKRFTFTFFGALPTQ